MHKRFSDLKKILTDEVLLAYSHEDSMALPDINAEGILLRHKKSGARVLLIPCDDDNKVFYIGFKTPPSSSSGTAHIMEHSVLADPGISRSGILLWNWRKDP